MEPILLAREGKDNVSPKPTCRNLKAPLLRNGLVSIHRGSRAAATIYADRGIPHHGNPPTLHMTKGIPSRQDGGQRVWTVFMREALIRRAAVTDVPRRAVSRPYRLTSISVVLTAGICRKERARTCYARDRAHCRSLVWASQRQGRFHAIKPSTFLCGLCSRRQSVLGSCWCKYNMMVYGAQDDVTCRTGCTA